MSLIEGEKNKKKLIIVVCWKHETNCHLSNWYSFKNVFGKN